MGYEAHNMGGTRATEQSSSNRPSRAALCMLVACVTALFAGCRSETGTPPAPKGAEVVKTAEAPGVTLRLSANSGDLALSDHLTVQIEIEAEDGITVAADSYKNALRESEHRFGFRLLGSTREESVPTGNGSLRWRYAYELEFVLPDTYELPPAGITYTDARPVEGKPKAVIESKSLETEPLTIVVRDVSDAHLSPEEMATVATPAPVELPTDWKAWWWVIPVLVTIVVISVLLLRRIRRERLVVKFVMPAHEWAQRELAALAADGLIDRGLIQQFHYRISDIVRGYVERRFDVAAPEMTTEEFLATVTSDGRFGTDITRELERFLESCDIVKYARVDPDPDGPGQLMGSAGDLVDRTKEDTARESAEGEVHRVEEHAV